MRKVQAALCTEEPAMSDSLMNENLADSFDTSCIGAVSFFLAFSGVPFSETKIYGIIHINRKYSIKGSARMERIQASICYNGEKIYLSPGTVMLDGGLEARLEAETPA